MTNIYSSLALSYRQWHYRMTPRQFEKPGGPAMGFSALQGANIFSLLMLVPSHVIPSWLFVSLPFIGGTCAFFLSSRIYRANPAPSAYVKLTDAVPERSEFPLVYAYLFCSLVLFVGCLYVAVQSAAEQFIHAEAASRLALSHLLGFVEAVGRLQPRKNAHMKLNNLNIAAIAFIAGLVMAIAASYVAQMD